MNYHIGVQMTFFMVKMLVNSQAIKNTGWRVLSPLGILLIKQLKQMKATVTFEISEEEIELFKDNLNFFTEEVDLNGNSCSEERAINHLLGCIRNENIRNIQYLNKPIRPVHIYFND